MKVLVLSDYADMLEQPIVSHGDTTIIRPSDLEVSDWPEADWVVSFGYRKIIQHQTIEQFKDRLLNIHISLLPWNKGADPNFWSWFDGTPKGVTIHRIADAIDGGDILAQACVEQYDFRGDNPTLHSTYNDLLVAASGLFHRKWYKIRNGEAKVRATMSKDRVGSYHRSGDKNIFVRYLTAGWNTSVTEIMELGGLYRGNPSYGADDD